jgi:ABC-type cobalt transport system substrate-binding protein
VSEVLEPSAAERNRRRRGWAATMMWMVVLAAPVGLTIGFVSGYLGEQADLPGPLALLRDVLQSPVFFVGLFAALMAWALAATLAYWRAIDELAREAHKRAWFWGGSLGMGAGLIALLIGSEFEPLASTTFAGASALEHMLFGGVFIYGIGLIGYLLAWAFVWWRAR